MVEKYCSPYTNFYRIPKLTVYRDERIDEFREKGFVMMVRDNERFREIISSFDPGRPHHNNPQD